ncbi:hypothetical protein [Desulfonatronum parangueonense]
MDSFVSRKALDAEKMTYFASAILTSDRVKESVKEKSADELLYHYGLSMETNLTNLGVLCWERPYSVAILGPLRWYRLSSMTN